MVNFREGYEKADPVDAQSKLELSEKVNLHQAFLARATRDRDTLGRLHGFLYLFYDYLRAEDFEEAARYLLEAETVAAASGNPDWQGWVAHRRGILSVHLKNYKAAILPYREAARLCGQAGDSLCMAESLVQLGAMYGRLEEFEQAHDYFDLALPLIEKYGSDFILSSALNNYANLLSTQDRPAEAIPYFERALTKIRQTGDKQGEVIFLGNLADAYRQLRRFDKALELLNQCVRINRENNWLHNLVTNYASISETYAGIGDFHRAYDLSEEYYHLRDSIIGVETQLKIADLEAKYAAQQKELELHKSRLALSDAQHKLAYGALAAFFLLAIVAAELWRRRRQARRAAHDLAQNRLALTDLTRLLTEKNAQIAALQALAPALDNPEQNLYDRRILTEADWAAFKVYFEKAHPDYLRRLRATYPALSDAEERLFLLIKLNLTRKEMATILGISADSVKKTRNRLRKRLELGEETDLDGHIRAF